MNRSAAARRDLNGVPNPIGTTTASGIITTSGAQNSLFRTDGSVKQPGDHFHCVFDVPVDFRAGDIVIFNQDPDANYNDFTEHDVRCVVENTISSAPPSPVTATNPTPATGQFEFTIQSIDRDKIDTEQKTWHAKLEQAKPIFEFKFPRFSYRYKYEDGEYSAFAPWSEIAFLPSDYDYLPKKGYNLGMTNQIRHIKILDYVPEDDQIPQDVIEIDILYKEAGKPNVYTVKTIKQTDTYPLWPNRQNFKFQTGTANPNFNTSSRGEMELESELIHAVVPSNQLLRHWDNVPRKAKSQEVSANRLVYGNYLQNYDLTNSTLFGYDKSIQPKIELSLSSVIAKLNDDGSVYSAIEAGLPTPGKSIKTLRTYQAGIVYLDEFGRETPVLVGEPTISTLKVEKENSPTYNNLNVKVQSPAPEWAKYWKVFIKETSNEYYNMAMDRWYNAEDGNIWLSFQSSDRNKVDEETFLILKKQHDNNTAVTDKARYKILAIENDAPDFIKINDRKVGTIQITLIIIL